MGLLRRTNHLVGFQFRISNSSNGDIKMIQNSVLTKIPSYIAEDGLMPRIKKRVEKMFARRSHERDDVNGMTSPHVGCSILTR